jgi:FkbM family methyltransferase
VSESGNQGCAWFDDRALVASLPAHLRAYAAYSRAAVIRRTGRVAGGSLLLRALARLTPALGLPREVRVRVAGRVVHLDVTDARFLWVLEEMRALSREYRIMQTLLRQGDTFLDVGANHGSYAILASDLVGREGRIVAIEPQPRLAQFVRRSLAETATPFEIHAVALADRCGDGLLHIPRSGSGSASIFGASAGPCVRVDVPIARADDLLAWRNFPGALFLKLDVEGSELAFLRGARTMISERRPVILFELNERMARSAGHHARDVIAELQSMGYRRFAEVDRFPLEVTGVADPEPQRNLVALPSSDSSSV